jgi:23S rRNA pseudouridine2605 synthase
VTERLNRFLARRGVASRRGADALISAGRVRVNDRPATVGTRVETDSDRVSVDGRSILAAVPAVALVLNKPAGFITAVSDPQLRPTVMSLVPDVTGLVPVGRLDADSRGLLLLTNDGELAHRVAHPRYGINKTYRVTAAGRIDDKAMEALRRGLRLEDGLARALDVRRLGATSVEVVMGEGRKREVRRLCAAAGIEVHDLLRTSVGPLRLGSLPEGAHRLVTADEEARLRQAVGMEDPDRRNPSVVTVDGPAGSGKSTVGARVAAALGLPFVDTGLYYRGVTLAAVRAGADATDTERLIELARRTVIEVNTDPLRAPDVPAVVVDGSQAGPELHDPRHAELLSRVSGIREVRDALLDRQRAAAAGGAVAAGRDCGTVVFPDARLKIFLRAPEPVRARRRAAQLTASGHRADAAVLASEVSGRDRADSTRAASPLRPAADAHIIDTEHVGIDELVQRILAMCAAVGLVAA